MVTILIAINVVIFLLDAFTPDLGKMAGGPPVGRHWLGSVLAANTSQWYLVWTWLTHGFAHAAIDSDLGLLHIGGNMLTLLFLGRPIEMRLGRDEFLKFYLVAIVAGFLGFWAVSVMLGYPGVPLVGASGAVSAVVVLFIFWFPKQKLLLWGILEMPAWMLGVLMLAGNIYYALAPDSNVAWEAHAAGALFGFLYFKLGWSFSQLQVPHAIADKIRGSGGLKIHNPDSAGRDEKLKQQADAILEKINVQGEGSLSSRERKTLQRYSDHLRKQRQ